MKTIPIATETAASDTNGFSIVSPQRFPAAAATQSIARTAHADPSRPLRAHAIAENGRPLCGGGNGARIVRLWQSDLAEPNCERCLAILARRANQPSHTFTFEI